MKASDTIASIGLIIKSLAKIVALSRPTSMVRPADAPGHEIIILANGPSLADTIREYGDRLTRSTCMAVNFAANAPEFTILRPRYYVMADPHFFERTSDTNVSRLYESLRAVSWPMMLLVPRKYLTTARQMAANPHITISTFNFVGLEGPAKFENFCYRRRLGMPRPRNVLIPALMCTLWLGYTDIKIAGADHSWLRSIWVNEANEVVSVQPHFYKEDQKEEKRVRSEYTNYRLHQILYSFYVAFKSYFGVERFARSLGARIVNVTPGSFIDAFERGELE